MRQRPFQKYDATASKYVWDGREVSFYGKAFKCTLHNFYVFRLNTVDIYIQSSLLPTLGKNGVVDTAQCGKKELFLKKKFFS